MIRISETADRVFPEFTYGTLEDAKIVKPEHSSMHLWASLVFSTFDEALEAACDMNGQELDGRLLRVSIVDPTTDDKSADLD
ncbi:hypothetical protein PsorP6_002485 [Peronosclerospora sorghi]|uniref:Uncharacterized protein n=1 Tax=Peronosclerospora sorghi TaxID=230839 RepID=A0ACC0WXE3_9STRA|nr:hypothetical protein PsorP6_002485 [Peronosclerospora sorghi]